MKNILIGPSLLIQKRHDKLLDLKLYNDTDDNANATLIRTEFNALHEQLMEDLPKLIELGKYQISLCSNRLLAIQKEYHQHVVETLSCLIGVQTTIDPATVYVIGAGFLNKFF